jgi:hypothetical protein
MQTDHGPAEVHGHLSSGIRAMLMAMRRASSAVSSNPVAAWNMRPRVQNGQFSYLSFVDFTQAPRIFARLQDWSSSALPLMLLRQISSFQRHAI